MNEMKNGVLTFEPQRWLQHVFTSCVFSETSETCRSNKTLLFVSQEETSTRLKVSHSLRCVRLPVNCFNSDPLLHRKHKLMTSLISEPSGAHDDVTV